MALNYFSLGHPLAGLRSRFSLSARRRMFDMFMQHLHPNANDSVLDVGVTPDATLVESNYFEAWYPHPERLLAVSIEDVTPLTAIFPRVRFAQVKPGPLPYRDHEFDIAFCSAVLEHVGDRAGQGRFLREITRVSRRFFVTTPNRGFPVEFHTMLPLLHWLPQQLHQRMLKALGHEFLSRTENLNLLGMNEILQLTEGLGAVHVERIRLFGMVSNLIVWGESIGQTGGPCGLE